MVILAGASARLALLVLLGACNTSETRDVVGPGTDTTGNNGGNVQRATLTITVGVAPVGQPAATALGWGSLVPGAEVDLVRIGSSTGVSAIADAQGVATFSDLLPGGYRVSGARVLGAAERAQLDNAGVPADAFGGGLSVTVTAPNTAITVPLSAGTRGSLVFSEATGSLIRDPAAGDYFFGQFIEIHNNSDTTIFLGAKTLMKGLPGWFDYPMFPCSGSASYQFDSLGIWGKQLYRFPGSVTAYPLNAGETAVIAVDAIDHSIIVGGGLNLTSADFELRGSADVDNPSVPDMISIGPSDGGYVHGHGLFLNEIREVLVLAGYVDPATLPSEQITEAGSPYNRIPGDLILDVMTLRRDFQESYPPCGESAVHPRFDAQDAKLLTRYDPSSAQRRVLFVDQSGRKVLQRTGTSSVDFIAGQPTPGSIP